MLAYFDKNLWDSTLPSESYKKELQGKKILLVSAGPVLKYFIMQRIRALGIGTVVILDTQKDWFAEYITECITCDDAVNPLIDPNHPELDPRIQSIKQYMEHTGIRFDGIWTFADRSVVLTAQIARYFGVPGIDPELLSALKNKQTLRTWLYAHRNILEQNCPRVRSLPSICYQNVTENDFPLIAKGVESVHKSLICVLHDITDLEHLLAEHDLATIALEPYFEGTDIDCNVLVQGGKIMWSGFVENFKARQPGFLENGSRTCSCLSEDEEQEIIAYVQNILDCAQGIQTACLHVEFRVRHLRGKFTFFLIEINFRLGGGENFVLHLGRDAQDLVLSNLELAFGMPLSQRNIASKSGMYGDIKTADLYVQHTGTIQSLSGPKNMQGILEYLFYAEIGNQCAFPPRGGMGDEIGWIVSASREGYKEAEKTLERALQETQINIKKSPDQKESGDT